MSEYPQYDAADARSRASAAVEIMDYERALHETEAAASLIRATMAGGGE